MASPKPLPRISVSADGSWAMIGQYRLDAYANDLAQFPNSVTSANIGGNAVDSKAGIIYAQILTASPQTTSATSSSTPAASAPSATPPVLSILDADNLAVREPALPAREYHRTRGADVRGRRSLRRLRQRRHGFPGRQIEPAAPAGDGADPTCGASGNFCNRNVITQNLTITDPGGGNTDFISLPT